MIQKILPFNCLFQIIYVFKILKLKKNENKNEKGLNIIVQFNELKVTRHTCIRLLDPPVTSVGQWTLSCIFTGQKFKDSEQLIYFNIFFLIQKKEIKIIKATRVASREGELLLQESCKLMRIHPGLKNH